MFDTHCHLAFDTFESRLEDVVSAAATTGVHGMITVSTTTSNVESNQAIARRFANVWFSAGVHPLHCDEPRDWSKVRAVMTDPKCVAWGELGLDRHYDQPSFETQRAVLKEQLDFLNDCRAEGVEKPIIVHCRKSFDDLLPIFAKAPFPPSRYVFHCFTGNAGDARKVLDFGASISFTGIVTYPNAKEVADAASLVPLDRMMVETDAPFLTPVPHRGQWPCEPKHVVDTARFLAELRGLSLREFEKFMDANARGFFGVPITNE